MEYDLEEMAWVIIANVSGGDWDKQSHEWEQAAEKWRDEYHAKLNRRIREEESVQDWILRLVTEYQGKYRFTDLLNINPRHFTEVQTAFWQLMDPDVGAKIKWNKDMYLVPTDGTEVYF